MNDYQKKYKMSKEVKQLMNAQMDRMDEEMSMLAKRFKVNDASDIIALYQAFIMFKIDRNGLETWSSY